MEGYLALIKEQREENDKLQEEIERLNKENKILRENAEHNDKVVDKVNWENKRLNNKLKDIKSQLDYLETYSSKEDVFEDMKRRLDRINKIIGSDKE